MLTQSLNDESLSRLKSDINSNIEKYILNNDWLSQYFKGTNWLMETNIPSIGITLKMPSGRVSYDCENAIELNRKLNLDRSQAIDERLWTYLSHVTFWKYMILRWNVENQKNPKNYILERYFTHGNRGLVRNGISRLWWAAELTKDNNNSNPYELTEVMFTSAEIVLHLLERTFPRNINFTRNLLTVFSKMDKEVYSNVKLFRELMRYFNSIGGVQILDTLDFNDIEKIVHEKMKVHQLTLFG
ncbi:DUF6339 family protein [Neobacillus vireti]|uniref:DUF6339 family protein n=1 Tax=Neobacillus vireti TaxID=220686 RepID=UPI0030005874